MTKIVANLDGLFGKGLYFSENSSKSDEYVVPDEQGLCYMFVCRVLLGRPFITANTMTRATRPPANPHSVVPNKDFDSVLAECQATAGDSEDQVCVSVP